MTPTFCWVFLLALVGRATSMPQPLIVDACALLCNPGAETESEQARDPVLFPRYAKVNCKLQSDAEHHQAWVIASECLKLCNRELTISLEVNCIALRSSLQANLGCYCEALTPLSPNTMRLHESWRLNYLVKELATDILNVITESPLDKLILCELHQEFFKSQELTKTTNGKLESCFKNATSEQGENKEEAAPSDLHESKFSIKTSTDEQELKEEQQDDPLALSLHEELEVEEDKEELIVIPTKSDTITHTNTQKEDVKENSKTEQNTQEMLQNQQDVQELCKNCLAYCDRKDTGSEVSTNKMFNIFCKDCEEIRSKCYDPSMLKGE